MKKTTTFEQAMSRLDEVINLLDTGKAPLDESLKLFSEGAELVAFCNSKLENAKLNMETLLPKDGLQVEADG